MKKHSFPPILLFSLLGFFLNAQSIYYVRPNDPSLLDNKFSFGVLDLSTCQDSTIFLINNTSNILAINDLAVCPDGTFYFSAYKTSFPFEVIGRLNPQDSSLEVLSNFALGNSLTCDANGILWGGGLDLYSYDPSSGAYNNYGAIGHALSGDLTFRNGKLFGTTQNNDLIEIDPNNLPATVVAYHYSLNQTMYGVVSVVKSCDSTVTYISANNDNAFPIPDTLNPVYAIDPIAQTTTFVCDMVHGMWGATTLSEFLASDCSVRLNLDPDTSSGAPPTDWQALPLCSAGSLIVADTDATYYSGYHTDSIRIRLLAPAPDSPLEYLTATAFGSVGVSGQGTGWLRLVAASSTAVAVANTDYQTSLRSVLWHNDALLPAPGLRTVEVIAFASGGRTDTSYAYLPVPLLPSAGQDTTFSACADATPFSLLAPASAAGGVWSPMLAGGVFSPQGDLPGTFSYTVGNGLCPADTAFVTVAILPLPVFSLGQDTSLCTHQLPLSLAATGVSLWQDGSNNAVFSASQPGYYWAEFTDASGCKFRDSILVSALPLQSTSGAIQSCYGQPYDWNGQSFTSDTMVCATFAGLNGCDSTHCLLLSFYYPVLALDTSICIGQSFAWLGTDYSTSGVFADTISVGGCLTATLLDLNVKPPDTVSLHVSICNGESHTVGGQTFSASGQYLVELPNVSGCDTTLRLDLTVRLPIQSLLAVSICPDQGYVFGGDTLRMPGNYSALLQTSEGCDSTLSLTLSHLLVPAPQISGDTLLCDGESTTLSTGFFSSYAWSNGENTATANVLSTGIYTVTVTGANGCTASADATVWVSPPIIAVWDTGDPLCHGDSNGFIALASISNGVEPIEYQINGAAPTSVPMFDGLQAGNWELVATDGAGCIATFALTISDPPELAVELGPSPELEVGDTYVIPVQVNQSGALNFAWSPPEGLDCDNCPNPTATAFEEITYSLLLTTADGCEASDTLTLHIKRNEDVYIPNIFSPNGDGWNEVLAVYGNVNVVLAVDLFQVYDRWGELLFDSKSVGLNDVVSGWNGTHRGRPVLPGVYVWYAEIRLADGGIIRKSAEVTLIR